MDFGLIVNLAVLGAALALLARRHRRGAITAGTVTSRLLGERAAEPAAPPAVVPVPLASPQAA
jgi:hypothetical protein